MGTYKSGSTKGDPKIGAAVLACIVLLIGLGISFSNHDDGYHYKPDPLPTITFNPPTYSPFSIPSSATPSALPSVEDATTDAQRANPRGNVKAGTYCSPAGATGYTSAGTRMVCSKGSDGKYRWRQG
jgi:hypothetical protein